MADDPKTRDEQAGQAAPSTPEPARADTPPAPDTAAPAKPVTPEGVAAKPVRPPRGMLARSVPPLPRHTMALLVVAAVILVTGLTYVVVQLAAPVVEPGQPRLGPEFEDKNNNFTIHPPVNWAIEDRHDGANIYIVGPKEKGYRPFIIVSLEIKAGGIESYLREHKGRINYQEKTTKWLSEDTDSIDGCPHTARLEYEWDYTPDDMPVVTVRTLQYVMEDKPRFYRVTCSVAADLYDNYLPQFEHCARSFRRTPLPKPLPEALP